MFVPVLILVFSAALLLFYLQAACETILRRSFEEPMADPVIEANRLEFPVVRQALAQSGAAADYLGLRAQLKNDYISLVYLLRNAANRQRRLSRSEWMLACYFRALSAALAVSHLAGTSEKSILLRMTAVLEYFTHAFGERIKAVRFSYLPASQ